MNFKIDVVVACAAGAMTGLSLGMCWELHHHYIMCRPRKRGWRSQAIYQHSLLIYSWPLHSEPLLTALKYRSEIIAPSRPWISMCDRHGGTRVLPECDGFVPGCNPLSYFYLFFLLFQIKCFRSFSFMAQHLGSDMGARSWFGCSQKAGIWSETA